MLSRQVADGGRMKKLSIGFVVVCTLVLWDFTFKWWMGDGMTELKGERRAAAQEFLYWAPHYCDAPLIELITRHRHVWVGQEPAACPTQFMYDAQLTNYTFLGIPIRRIFKPTCQSIQCR